MFVDELFGHAQIIQPTAFGKFPFPVGTCLHSGLAVSL
jgi:hypothetical protein